MMKKRLGQITDILMYSLLLAMMLYVFIGNNVHEILGMGFFDVITCLLILTVLALMISSLGVSRFIFPRVVFMGSSDLHRYLATAVLSPAMSFCN